MTNRLLLLERDLKQGTAPATRTASSAQRIERSSGSERSGLLLRLARGMDASDLPGAGEGGEPEPLSARSIPPAGLVIKVNTADGEIDLGFIRIKKHHLFVSADIHIEPSTDDADKPESFGLRPEDEHYSLKQPGQSGKPGTVSRMRWYNLGPSLCRWTFWRGLSLTDKDWKLPPVRSSLVGTLTFTEGDTWG